MRRYIGIFLLLVGTTFCFGQEAKLAQRYFQNGEFEKAAVMYEKLYKKNDRDVFYFNRYIESRINLEQYAICEKVLKKRIKKYPKQMQLYVTYGNLYERQNREQEAKQQYNLAIKNLPAKRNDVIQLANAFRRLTKYSLAIDTYTKGGKLLKDEAVFAYNLGDLYRLKGNTSKMIESYLISLEKNPTRLNNLKSNFQRYLNPEDLDELQTQLYQRVQANQEATYYPELLGWVFIQKKDYKNAFRQARAIDRKNDENGGRVYRIATIAANAKDYETAIAAFEYIVNEKGEKTTYYIEAKEQSLNCKRNRIVDGYDYSAADLFSLEQEYETFLNEFGRNKTTATIIAELANLEALYLNNIDKAITLLTEMIAYPGLNRNVQAEAKLTLADYYLIQGEIWEATLLYSQVDKAFKDDILGHMARFRNAKLSYYAGDFRWAQTQFDVLKASTSKLIANDALDLSVFIMDNLGLDTTTVSLTMYAQADLLVFQNRFDDAFAKLDSLIQLFPDHALQDDVLYAKALIHLKRRHYPQAADMFQKVVDNYSEEIRADNALFKLAELYETVLDDTEKAKLLYERIFIDFSDSTFAVTARKRFRILRGDNLQ